MSWARDLAYRGVVASGWARRRIRRQGAAAVFCFHNVTARAPAVGDASLHVPASDFDAYLDWIAGLYRVVSLSELVERVEDGRSTAGLAALSFDDAYAGFFRHAVPALRRRGLPATVFVVTGVAADPAPFWWDLLGVDAGLTDTDRRRCLEELQGDREAVLAAFDPAPVELGDELVPVPWSTVEAERDELLHVGSHTRSHLNLAVLDPEQLREQLSGSFADMEERLGGPPGLVSYPYGALGPDTRSAAADAGYRGGVTLVRGHLASSQDPLLLPRINVPAGISLDALECRAAGIPRP